ncbi:MAG TPA: class III extradiol ring-cleavage dioxygenase [Candidatus Bathyarchaeia archaeon]|nr:class III extradiol ring-cleavage dioxygenase [Candidatus Bathyarchaeia archaeon]
MTILPALFIGHGSPINLFESNPFTNALRNCGKKLFQNFNPKAIVIISAHWLTQGTYITADNEPKMIYDYYGFPKKFYEYFYPAKGSFEIAKWIADHFPKIIIPTSDWGIDHAATIVLENILPSGKIPILELSLDYRKPLKYHYDLGQKLGFLREEGILFIASGNLIHTFREIDFNMSVEPFDWAKQLDAIQKESIDTHNLDSIYNFDKMSLNKRGFQTMDHYIPLLYILGMKQNSEQINYIFEGFQHGSVSHRSFEVK